MVKGHKSPRTIVSEVKMIRMVHDGGVLVVEGADDMRFWRTRKHSSCELVEAEGKPNVVESLARLDAECCGGVLGVVDDDYDKLVGAEPESANLLATDAHDLECMLCRSTALDRVLVELGDPAKIASVEEMEETDIRNCLLNRALVIGKLRWAAIQFGLDVDTDAIKIARFVSIDTWLVDEEALIDTVSEGGLRCEQQSLREKIELLPGADPWCVAKGHDVLQLLRLGLRRILGSMQNSIGVKHIAGLLRSGVSVDDLESTLLWANIRDWETVNSGSAYAHGSGLINML